jgi:hypothetical protein
MFWPEHYTTHSVTNGKRVCKLSLYQYHANTRIRLSFPLLTKLLHPFLHGIESSIEIVYQASI